jgi:hypothetical protein
MDSALDGRCFQMGIDRLVDPDQLSMALQIVDALLQTVITHTQWSTVGVRGGRIVPDFWV